MSNLPMHTIQSLLMEPVEYQGQTYFSSQYFHQQYLANSEHAGKYRRLDSFMRLLRSIEAYQEYAALGAIVELRWPALKQEQPQLCGYFKPLFQAAGWQSLTLLNKVAQIELSHHLDDALSKQMAVTASTFVARQGSPLTLLDQFPELKAIADMGRSIVALAQSTAEARTIAEEAKAELQQVKRAHALTDAKATMALDDAHRMTLEEFILKNGLIRQFPPDQWPRIANWLRQFCENYNLATPKVPVLGKSWTEEKQYSLQALAAWLRYETIKPRQIRLVDGNSQGEGA